MTLGVDVSNTDTSNESSTIGTAGSNTTVASDQQNSLSRIINNFSNLLSQATNNSNTTGTSTNLSTGTSSSTTDETGTTNSTSTSGSDPAAIADARIQLAQARTAASDTHATDLIVQNIIQKTAQEFAPIAAQTNQAGIYNSTTNKLLQDNAAATATQQAASTVLGYQQGEETRGDNLTQQLLNALKITQTSGTSGTTGKTSGTTAGANTGTTNSTTTGISTNAQGTTGGSNESDVLTNLLASITNVFSNNSSQTSGSSNSTNEKGGLSVSIICTELHMQGKMSREDWAAGMREFNSYPNIQRESYYFWAIPFTSYITRRPCSLITKIATKVFCARAKHKFWARSLVAGVTLVAGILRLYTLVFGYDISLEEEKGVS